MSLNNGKPEVEDTNEVIHTRLFIKEIVLY